MNDATGPEQGPCTWPAEAGVALPGGPFGHLVTRVARLHRTAAGRALRETGLYPGQEIVLGHLWEAGRPVRQSELIKAVELDPSTVTKTLQRLEQAGHVSRTPDPADRRAVLVEATPLSCGLSRQVEAAWAGLEEYALAGLTRADRAELGRLLAAVEANLCDRVRGCPEQGEPQG
ncbi:MarR family winged helix-turn-helix transcriptional regulator [Streptomyces sp. NPDC058374]|uniref:MarR family winged helix-turn-helix transcriptional regulator n=1 Tax=unclassified Streptomyces TaxID=2593676 RepID=UPI0036639158